jgi:hypothetical protein
VSPTYASTCGWRRLRLFESGCLPGLTWRASPRTHSRQGEGSWCSHPSFAATSAGHSGRSTMTSLTGPNSERGQWPSTSWVPLALPTPAIRPSKRTRCIRGCYPLSGVPDALTVAGLRDPQGEPRSASRPWITTGISARASASAVARPMPLVDPVIRAVVVRGTESSSVASPAGAGPRHART